MVGARRAAQRDLFGHTAAGDLRHHLSGFFDTTSGAKVRPAVRHLKRGAPPWPGCTKRRMPFLQGQGLCVILADFIRHVCGWMNEGPLWQVQAEKASYDNIALSLGVDAPEELLFATDSIEEAEAAVAAGWQVHHHPFCCMHATHIVCCGYPECSRCARTALWRCCGC